MEIVRVCQEDAGELAELDKEVFSVPWSEKSFRDECNNSLAVYFAAREDNKIIGYAGFWHIADEGDITNIAVREKFRRRGVASLLIEEMIKEADKRKLSLLTLEVRKSNLPAIGLYNKFGFNVIGERKNYYTKPTEDALIMTLYFGGIYG